MKVIADLNDRQEKTLRELKRLGYVLNQEVNTKPQQINFGMDILQHLMWEFSEEQIIEIYIKNKQS